MPVAFIPRMKFAVSILVLGALAGLAWGQTPEDPRGSVPDLADDLDVPTVHPGAVVTPAPPPGVLPFSGATRRTAFVVSTARSMATDAPSAGSEPCSRLQAGMEYLVPYLELRVAALAMVEAGDTVRVWPEGTEEAGLVTLSPEQREQAVAWLRGLQASPEEGNGGLRAALESMLNLPGIEEIYVVADGLGGFPAGSELQGVKRLLAELPPDRRPVVNVVSVAPEGSAGDRLLAELAMKTGGFFVRP